MAWSVSLSNRKCGLNQIDQWLAWQRHGVVPTPTDGWVPSTVTLPDDRLPLAPADLDPWLWRVGVATRRRAGGSARSCAWPPVAAEDASIVYAGLYGVLAMPDEVLGLVLAIEGELLAGSQ